MDKKTQAQINKIRSNYDALAQAYAREVAGELDHRPLERTCYKDLRKSATGLFAILDVAPGMLRVT